jgi:hypothetical protein
MKLSNRSLAEEKQKFKTLPAKEAVELKEKLNKDLNKARVVLNDKFYNILKSKKLEFLEKNF